MVSEGSVRHEIDMVGIIVAVMVIIVTSRGSDRCDQVQIVQLCHCAQVPIFDEHVHTLRHISTVQVIVILNIPSVPLENGVKEADQFIVVDHTIVTGCLGQIVNDLEDNHLESIFAAEHSVHLQTVEIVAINR